MTVHARQAHDLAISAVAYDALLVGELMTRLAIRLRHAPLWAGSAATVDGVQLIRAEHHRICAEACYRCQTACDRLAKALRA